MRRPPPPFFFIERAFSNACLRTFDHNKRLGNNDHTQTWQAFVGRIEHKLGQLPSQTAILLLPFQISISRLLLFELQTNVVDGVLHQQVVVLDGVHVFGLGL